MGTAKEDFLREFGADYGYPDCSKSVDEIRATEFKRLDGLVYLDHAGATLYSELQMEAVYKDLTTNVYGNPHSQSDSSSATSNIVREARQQVLNYCKASAKDYKCIFTSGATAALKLVGEAFPWSQQSSFVYTVENHNSVLGIREYALDQGAIAFAIDIEDTDQGESGGAAESIRVSKRQIQRRCESRFLEKDQTGEVYNLFAFPSECNFSGSKLSLELVKIVKENSRRILGGSPFCDGQWMVLIDAAKGCATEPPDLSKYPADFVVISFYKLFGYPTGLGALIIRTDAAKLLKKTYFSGGTVAASIADIDYVKRREGIEELFEDGTASFLSIASIHHGFKILNSLTAPAISRHTTSIAMYLRKVMLALRHENGASICTIYGNYSKAFCNDFGPIVSFNLKRPDGSWFGYREVEKLASLSGIQLRTGCFCNPGACAKYLGLSHLDLLSNIEAGHVCWDDYDVVKGKPTGAVRVSFGYMSTYEDAKKFIEFLTSYFVPSSHQTGNGNILISRSILPVDEDSESRSSTSGFCLKSITVYPIKSCAGFSPDSWPMSNTGLKHDREWLLRSLNGQVLTQKKVPEMCFVSTLINMEWGVLSVESPCCKERLQINLKSDFYDGGREEMHLHGQKYYVQGYDDEVNNWFSTAIGQQCTLLRCFSSDNSLSLDESKSISTCRDARSLMNFSNEAQLLLISEDSVSDLNSRIRSNLAKGPNRRQIQVSSMRFRPNLVVSGGQPYDEDGWRILRIGNMFFTSVGGCNRCQMINFVHEDGQVVKSKEPLSTLALYRRMKGKILFGILLRYEGGNELKHDDESWLQVGDGIYPNIGP